MTLTRQGRRVQVESFRDQISKGAVRLFDGSKLLVRLPLKTMSGKAIASGTTDRFDVIQPDDTVVLEGKIGKDLNIEREYIEAGAEVTLRRFDVGVSGYTSPPTKPH